VLARDKFRGLARVAVRKLLADRRERALWIDPRVAVDEAKEDPADNAFLECALEAQADFLITGNTKHFPSGKFHNTQILTPGEFISCIALDT
jgi:predicted nucleic acid-binding protein